MDTLRKLKGVSGKGAPAEWYASEVSDAKDESGGGVGPDQSGGSGETIKSVEVLKFLVQKSPCSKNTWRWISLPE